MQESRRFIRWRLCKQVSIRLQDSSNLVVCNADDISLKGIKLRSNHPLMGKASLKMTIALGQEVFLNNIEVSVAWAKKEGNENIYGLYFTRIKDADKEAISQFVLRNSLEKLNQDYCRGQH